MATAKQIEANRKNALKSTGPTSPAGKDRARFNGLKHGLRAEQVVIPGENQADFDAERQGFFDDWKPTSHTRAVLVERAAIASWRLQRSVRIEGERLRDLAEWAERRFDANDKKLIARAIGRLDDDPADCLKALRSDPAGFDYLVGLFKGLDAALADPAQSDDLLRRLRTEERTDDDPAPLLALRLVVGLTPEALDAGIEAIGAALEGLRAETLRIKEGFVDNADCLRLAVAKASFEDTKLAQLHHRYEMAHDRSLRASIHLLMALDKSGADEAEWDEPQAQISAPSQVEPPEPAAPTEANPPADAPEETPESTVLTPIPPAPAKSDRDRKGRTWPPRPADGTSRRRRNRQK